MPGHTAREGAQLFQAKTVQGVGTVGYFPPEFFDAVRGAREPEEDMGGRATYGARAFDAFSMGMILLYMVGVDVFIFPSLKQVSYCGDREVVMPFNHEQNFDVLEDAPPEFRGTLDEEAPRFERFWAQYPELSQRLSSECKDLVNRCMVKNPLQRITLDDTANHPFMARGRRPPRGAGGQEAPYPSTEEISKELQDRNVLVVAHPGLTAVVSSGAIGMASLQAAHSGPRAAGGYSEEWDAGLDVPMDRMFEAVRPA